jgi:hypothetical protein
LVIFVVLFRNDDPDNVNPQVGLHSHRGFRSLEANHQPRLAAADQPGGSRESLYTFQPLQEEFIGGRKILEELWNVRSQQEDLRGGKNQQEELWSGKRQQEDFRGDRSRLEELKGGRSLQEKLSLGRSLQDYLEESKGEKETESWPAQNQEVLRRNSRGQEVLNFNGRGVEWEEAEGKFTRGPMWPHDEDENGAEERSFFRTSADFPANAGLFR